MGCGASHAKEAAPGDCGPADTSQETQDALGTALLTLPDEARKELEAKVSGELTASLVKEAEAPAAAPGALAVMLAMMTATPLPPLPAPDADEATWLARINAEDRAAFARVKKYS